VLIRKALSRVIESAERLFKKSPESAQIRDMLLQMHRDFSAVPPERRSASVNDDFSATRILLGELGWIDESPPSLHCSSEIADLLAAGRDWRTTLPKRGVLESGRFAAGAGRILDILDRLGTEEEGQFARVQSERLLRHVESRRQLCLSQSIPALPTSELLLQRCEVAILFSRLAVRRRDLRYLNTALKMNDWFLNARPDRWAPAQRARLMRSLAEQEFAAEALL